MKKQIPWIKPKPSNGFALISTILLMVLLAIITVGTLSLSVVTLRSGNRDSAHTQARANARLALMLAIGELQKQAGPDTRITAPADILDETNPPLTGVWRSWEGTNHEIGTTFAGRPIVPIYGDKTKPASSGGRFLKWLVSGAGDATTIADAKQLVSKTATAETIPMVSSNSLGASDTRQVHLKPVMIDSGGAMAWWVSGENQKARLPQPYQPVSDTVANWSDLAKSHAVVDPKPFELDALLADPTPAAKVITLNTADLIAATNATIKPHQFFHDLSVSSVGLLTNTATGGWRKDLSLVTENWDNLPASGLPFFRIDSSYTTSVSKPTAVDARATQSIIYPWSNYNMLATSSPTNQHGVVSSWHNLKDYATAYQRITGSGASYSIPFTAHILNIPTELFNCLHKIRTIPVIARIHWVFSHQTSPLVVDPVDPSKTTFTLKLLMTPVVTMWNPFNVSITSPANLRISLPRPLPCAFGHYDKDGNPLPKRMLLNEAWPANSPPIPDILGNYADYNSNIRVLYYDITSSFTLAPGETRVFSPTSQPALGSAGLPLSPGYNPGNGHVVDLSTLVGPLNATSPVKVDVAFDAQYSEGATSGARVGIYLDLFTAAPGNKNIIVNRMAYTQAMANQYWPPIPASDLVSRPAEEINGVWQPFISVVYGSRISGPSSTGLPGKGLLQASPLVSYARMGPGYTGVTHPANAANDFSIFKHTGNDDKLPNANNTNNRGYIISGFTAADGLSRVILSELPLRPLASLGELQHWDLRFLYGYPPYQSNIIGNSDATPLLPANKVFNTSGNPPTPVQYDDAYCTNHLFFDDWFLSSIAPEPSTFGNALAADLQTRYKQFLSGTKPLTNRNYRPIPKDLSLDATAQTARYNDLISADGWQRVASRLEVDGMFNVNSTSVVAWRALLGHARNQKIPYFAESGIALAGKTDHTLSRSIVAGDTEAGEQGISGGFPESSELTGYRVFSDTLLDDLAQKIVDQVRLRGPFLSLSEFVNRQLTTDKNLALAGAIQTALNKMSDEAGAGDPYLVLKSPVLSQDAGNPADPKLVGSGYQFPEAAVGKSNFGMPGWIRQADILRPLAPILSARDDTFTVRAYGDARDSMGRVVARVWCEATVHRTRDFVDPSDPADSIDAPTSNTNVRFGRRYIISSFRWLSPNEV